MLLISVTASAMASAVEAPAWFTNANRLEGEHSKSTESKNPSGKEIILHGELENSKTKKIEIIEIRCKKIVISKQSIIGSLKEHDGTESGTFEFSECTFWAVKVEQKACKVKNFEAKELSGRLWLEGTEGGGGNKIVIAWTPKGVITEVTIEGNEECAFKKGSPYALEGKFAASLPYEKEEAILNYSFPEKAITHVYQPPQQKAEETLELKFGGRVASFEGEVENGLTSKETFGGFAPLHLYRTGVEKPITKAFAIEGSSVESLLESTIALEKIFIQCKADSFTGQIEIEGENKGTISFKECKLLNSKKGTIAGCKVTEPIETKVKSKLVNGPPVEDEFVPAAGEIFVTIEILGCEKTAFNGKYEVKGSQICKLPEGEKEKAEHTIECTKTGSKLKLGLEKASFESKEEKVKLTGKPTETWSAV
jgi:hypothetical protein